MPFVNLLFTAGLTILIMMTLLWLISLALQNASIVDIFWGPGFVIVTWLAFALTQGYLPRKQLAAALVTVWGLRLALHIARRNWGKGEDFRYAQWRQENGARWSWLSFFQVFLLQGLLMWIISAPLLAAQTSGFPAILTPLDLIGASLWIIGLLVESAADAQLTRFKADPANRGKLMTTGFNRLVEVQPPSQLLRRGGGLVGFLCDRPRRRLRVDGLLPHPDDLAAGEGLRRGPARTDHEAQTGV